MLKIAVYPLDIAYADPAANLKAVESCPIEQDTDLLVLPELFSTGFIKNPEKKAMLAEDNEGATITTLKRFASERQLAVAGSFLAGTADGSFFNRAFLILSDGSLYTYDKHHLFSYSGEQLVLSPGEAQSPVADYKGWRIKLSVCYDLRFPVWSRNVDCEYDIMLFPSNWPEAREYAFRHLLIARAIENQAVTVGANRGGEDKFGVYPADMSQIFDWLGRPVGKESRGVVYATLSHEALSDFRQKFPAHLDADSFTLK